jgi:hypothetical protein
MSFAATIMPCCADDESLPALTLSAAKFAAAAAPAALATAGSAASAVPLVAAAEAAAGVEPSAVLLLASPAKTSSCCVAAAAAPMRAKLTALLILIALHVRGLFLFAVYVVKRSNAKRCAKDMRTFF